MLIEMYYNVVKSVLKVLLLRKRVVPLHPQTRGKYLMFEEVF